MLHKQFRQFKPIYFCGGFTRKQIHIAASKREYGISYRNWMNNVWGTRLSGSLCWRYYFSLSNTVVGCCSDGYDKTRFSKVFNRDDVATPYSVIKRYRWLRKINGVFVFWRNFFKFNPTVNLFKTIYNHGGAIILGELGLKRF